MQKGQRRGLRSGVTGCRRIEQGGGRETSMIRYSAKEFPLDTVSESFDACFIPFLMLDCLIVIL